MKVELVQHTPNPLKLITDVASICYGKEEANYPERLLRHLNKLGHHSVFEHVYYTFKITGISTACLGQLTRHRHASFSVRSQRYCDESESEVIIPQAVLESGFDPQEFIIDKIMEYYQRMLNSGIKREDARFILPRGVTTDLYMSCNLRELIHIWNLRVAPQAQEEIRNLVSYMVSEVTNLYPELRGLFEEEK